jgi:hypothetical protein
VYHNRKEKRRKRGDKRTRPRTGMETETGMGMGMRMLTGRMMWKGMRMWTGVKRLGNWYNYWKKELVSKLLLIIHFNVFGSADSTSSSWTSQLFCITRGVIWLSLFDLSCLRA